MDTAAAAGICIHNLQATSMRAKYLNRHTATAHSTTRVLLWYDSASWLAVNYHIIIRLWLRSTELSQVWRKMFGLCLVCATRAIEMTSRSICQKFWQMASWHRGLVAIWLLDVQDRIVQLGSDFQTHSELCHAAWRAFRKMNDKNCVHYLIT